MQRLRQRRMRSTGPSRRCATRSWDGEFVKATPTKTARGGMMEATMFGRLKKLTLTTLAFGGVLCVGGGTSAFADPGPIAPPTDPVALAAFNVLQNNCARCHQDGLLKGREKPADNFGNILRL